MTIHELQKALLAKGFDPGPVDGIAGPKTRSAVRAFQAQNGLEPSGIAGPKTAAKLLGKSAVGNEKVAAAAVAGDIPADLPWLNEAKRLIGTTEIKGPQHNSVIIGMGQAGGIQMTDDETPWCGLFVSHCIASTLPDEAMPANPLGARQWLKFGDEVTPQFGSTLVFWRESPSSFKGHVGFYWAEDDLHYHVLGGNQSDSVSVTRLIKSRLLGARWPQSVPPRNMRRMVTGAMIEVSENEA